MNTRSAVMSVAATMTMSFLMVPAHADKAQIFRYASDFDFGPVVECGDFDVWARGWEIDTEKYWFDDFGDPVRLQFSIHVKESEYYNSTDDSKFVSQGKNGVGENLSNNIDLTTGDQHISGVLFRLTIPKIGHVLRDAGTWWWDASEEMMVHQGPNFVLAEGETGLALCEALE